jgi:hypothetical protein
MCGCGCDAALALASLEQRSCEAVDEVDAGATRTTIAPVAEPTVGCWESFKLALHRVASERAAALARVPKPT